MTFRDDTIVITFAIICNQCLRTLVCKFTVVLLAGFVSKILEHFPHCRYSLYNKYQI